MKKNIRLFAAILLMIIFISSCSVSSPTLATSPFVETAGLSITQFFDNIDELNAELTEK